MQAELSVNSRSVSFVAFFTGRNEREKVWCLCPRDSEGLQEVPCKENLLQASGRR